MILLLALFIVFVDNARSVQVLSKATFEIDIDPLEQARQILQGGEEIDPLRFDNDTRTSRFFHNVRDGRVLIDEPLVTYNAIRGEVSKRERQGEFTTVYESMKYSGWKPKTMKAYLAVMSEQSVRESGVVQLAIERVREARKIEYNKRAVLLSVWSRRDGSYLGAEDGKKSWFTVRTAQRWIRNVQPESIELRLWLEAAPAGLSSMQQALSPFFTLRGRLVLTIEWNATHIRFLQGRQLLDTLNFARRVEPLQHIFLGSDNTNKRMQAAPGLLFRALRFFSRDKREEVGEWHGDDEIVASGVSTVRFAAKLATLERHDDIAHSAIDKPRAELLDRLKRLTPRSPRLFGVAHFMRTVGQMPGKYEGDFDIMQTEKVGELLTEMASAVNELSGAIEDVNELRASLGHSLSSPSSSSETLSLVTD